MVVLAGALTAFVESACKSDSPTVSSSEPPPSGADDASAASDAGGVNDATSPSSPSPDRDAALGAACAGATPSASTVGMTPSPVAGLTVPAGFVLEHIADVAGARQLAALPNGDLLVATSGTAVYLVPNAEADGAAGKPTVFGSVSDAPVQGVTFDGPSCTVFFGAQHGVHAAAYKDGDLAASSITKIASVRTGAVAPNSDGDIHSTTSVGVASGVLFASVGSSCNACIEVDTTRASIQQMGLDGSGMTTKATRLRNGIAVATNTDTGTLWVGNAGQDDLPGGHPYELFDGVTVHPGIADYGWPACEESRVAYIAGSDCSATVVPRVVLPAYSTLTGAAYYAVGQSGNHAFPAANRGFFVAAHGSWHKTNGTFVAAPRVVHVAMNGDEPAIPVDWSNPTKQWTDFVTGFQKSDGVTRIARPAGLAVGRAGSLFIADDQNGAIYRVRPQ